MELEKANAMPNDRVRVNKPYKIPQTGGVPLPERVALPARRIPPSPTGVVDAGTKRGWDGEPCRRVSAARD